jgi:hypothetical protein
VKERHFKLPVSSKLKNKNNDSKVKKGIPLDPQALRD